MITEKAIEEMITEIASLEAILVYKMLKDKPNLNEFIIVDKLKITINQLRNIMYKFEKHNLISSTRKKDRKKGWYIYFFTFNPRQADDVVLQLKREKIKILEKQMERETSHEFYACPNKDIRLTLENAMEHNFTCTECGQLLVPEDQKKNIARIQEFISKVKNDLAELEKPAPEKPKKIEVKKKHKVMKKIEIRHKPKKK